MDSHEKYLQLCAVSTANELSGEEERELEGHLAVCASCRQAKREFELALQAAVPALESDVASFSVDADPDWSVEKAEAAFFKRLKDDQSTPPAVGHLPEKAEDVPTGQRFTYRPSRIPWATLWMPVAACALLAAALGIVAYRSGLK